MRNHFAALGENLLVDGLTRIAENRAAAREGLEDADAARLLLAGVDEHIEAVQQVSQFLQVSEQDQAIPELRTSAVKQRAGILFVTRHRTARDENAHRNAQIAPDSLEQVFQLLPRTNRAGHTDRDVVGESVLGAEQPPPLLVGTVMTQIEPVGQRNLRCQMCAIQFRRYGP